MKKHLLQRHERDQIALSDRREPLVTIDENAGKRRHTVVADAPTASTPRALSLPALVHVVTSIEMHAFIRRWHKAPMWAFSFVLAQHSDDDVVAATVRGVAICFIDDLTTVQYIPFDGNHDIVQLVDRQVRHQVFNRLFFFNFRARVQVFASRDRSGRVSCKVTHPIRDAVLAMAQLQLSAAVPGDAHGLFDPVAELHSRDRRSGVALHYAADRAAPRRGLAIDASRLPPFQCAVMRAVQAAAAMRSPMLVGATNQLCVASRIGVLLAQIEQRGVAVDRARLDALLKRARALSQQCERHALALARASDLVALRAAVLTRGERLSLSSLERAAHPAAVWWARSRRIESLIRHGETLMACALPSGAVHCRFDGAHHENGRINSVDPNLQCLPKALCVLVPNRGSQDDERLALRSCIVARQNCVFVSADFRQMELRLVTALSNENRLLASNEGDGSDAFVRIAALCGERTSRAQAKEVFYAALYGAGTSNIARTLACDVERATVVLAELRSSFPALFAWRERVVNECRAAGNTIASPVYGAKRHIGELSCEDAAERAAAERRVVNGLVQCTAAEIFVTAMINVQSAVRDVGAHVVLPLHDELLVEVAREHVARVVDAMREHMCIQVCANQPALEIFVRAGETWDDMTPLPI